jgi:hypothetical protein
VLHLPLHPQNEEGMAIVDLPAGAASPAAFCGRFLLHAHLWRFSPFAASFSPPTVTSPTPTDPPSPLLVAARTHDCDHPRPQQERQRVADDLPDRASPPVACGERNADATGSGGRAEQILQRCRHDGEQGARAPPPSLAVSPPDARSRSGDLVTAVTNHIGKYRTIA